MKTNQYTILVLMLDKLNTMCQYWSLPIAVNNNLFVLQVENKAFFREKITHERWFHVEPDAV